MYMKLSLDEINFRGKVTSIHFYNKTKYLVHPTTISYSSFPSQFWSDRRSFGSDETQNGKSSGLAPVRKPAIRALCFLCEQKNCPGDSKQRLVLASK